MPCFLRYSPLGNIRAFCDIQDGHVCRPDRGELGVRDACSLDKLVVAGDAVVHNRDN